MMLNCTARLAARWGESIDFYLDLYFCSLCEILYRQS
jgi:hypothetical protein